MEHSISSFRRNGLPERICLIIPPSIFLLDERVFTFLGILRVAAVLEQAGIKVEVLDLSGIKNFLDVVRDYALSRRDVRHFGITATTPQLPAVTKIVETIKGGESRAKIILGGPHITLVNAAYKGELERRIIDGRAAKALKHLEGMFDVLVAGDGEEAIFSALAEGAPKLVDADDPKSPLFLDNKRLTALPFPARQLIDMESYHYHIDGARATSLIAQLGCPFACGFCGGRNSPMLRRIRTRTSESIVAEMVHIYRTYGLKGFMFYDDELNVNAKIMELMTQIAQAQKYLGVEWRLRGFIKSQLFTDGQAEAMYRAGFRWILVGFESGSEKILTAINKKANRMQNSRCVEIAKRNGLKVKALMSMGHPGESSETIKQTKDWLLEVKPDDFDMTIITAYPGTPYYDQAVPAIDKGEGVWVHEYEFPEDPISHSREKTRLYQMEIDFTQTADYYKGDPDGGYHAYVFTDHLSAEDLVRERDALEREVRAKLRIPFNPSAPSVLYEHSMGQSGRFPANILRTTA